LPTGVIPPAPDETGRYQSVSPFRTIIRICRLFETSMCVSVPR
jgi:hypothetical protein